MLWDPGSVKDEGEEHDNAPITPILVPLQNKPPTVEKGVPVLVPDVQDLKDQFQQQQNMLTQIKETLKQNESQLSSKGRQIEVYANKLSQIRARSKNTHGIKPSAAAAASPSSPNLQKKSSKESSPKAGCPEGEKPIGTSSKNRKGKVSELKKCLEENKIKFEQRTGKEQSETKKIESLVEQLKVQVEKRDKTIHDLQKTIEEPTLKPEPLPKQKSKPRETVASKTTQTATLRTSDESIEVIALQNKIQQLEANVLDLEENLKEKESVIEARTQAVTLLSQDLSLKGKSTLESLEETRQEMRTMQSNFVLIEDQLKKDLQERNDRLATLEEKYKKLESTNFDLSLRNAEQQEKLINLQTKYLELEAQRKSLNESAVRGQTDDKLDELTKKINALTKELDDRNKAMIKMKIEHKNKIKSVNNTLELLKGTSEEKAEIVKLSATVEELEKVKNGLENRVAELEDEKASEKKLKDQINELEIIIKKQNDDLTQHVKAISQLEKENFDLIQSNHNKNVLVENLHARIADMESDKENQVKEWSERWAAAVEEHNAKVEELKAEHRKEIEMVESYYSAKGDSPDRKALEEYRISTEISNIHAEEQIELLVREKQQLLEKLKNLTGVSSTDSLTFEKMEHSDLKDDRDAIFPLGEEVDIDGPENKAFHLERIVSDQQRLISDLQKTIAEEKEKVQAHQQRITELEETIKSLEDENVSYRQQIEMSGASESAKSSKSNTNAKNRIKKIEMELNESKKAVQEQREKLDELRLKLQEKEDIIGKYSERIEMFEKDDWDRENHWRNAEEGIEDVQELQKKCLGLENSLYELGEDCERLRKENIEVVHLLSEEKVKRRRLLEELEAKGDVEKRVQAMIRSLEALEEKVCRLESCHVSADAESEAKELQEKLEWTNVVLTSKETEMFRLQNLLEDRSKAMEILEADAKELKEKLAERTAKLEEITKELKTKEAQLEEISANFDRLQDSVNATNEKTVTNESQLKELLSTVKDMEGDVFRKETELQKIKGILAEKNLDMANLRNRLEEVNSDLTYSYQEHLENMGKCLRDKESDYDALLAEKTLLEEVNRRLVSEKEDIYNEKVEMAKEKEIAQSALSEKDKIISELQEKLKIVGSTKEEGTKNKSQEKEDLKIKLKKLAANLKKKAQIEADLSHRVSELEGLLSEKEKATKELSAALEEQTGKQIQVLQEECIKWQAVEREDKAKICHLEEKVAEYENAAKLRKQTQEDVEIEKRTLLQRLAETTGKYEKMKFDYEQLRLEQSETERKLEELQRTHEELLLEKSSLEAKLKENFAVIEGLEEDLKKIGDQMRTVEEKLFFSEDRRLSLESKNEEMCKKILENSENLTTIDDLSVRVDELLRSEKRLHGSVQELQSGNSELKQTLDQITTEKTALEKELKASNEKLSETAKELKELRNSDEEKNAAVRSLTEAVERLKAEKKQLKSDFDKLNKDYEQFEFDFKENVENLQNVEKSLKHKVEELVNENKSLSEKCKLLSEGQREEDAEERRPKKRKSVTFRTDEVEYIKELKSQLHEYDAGLKKAQAEVETLREELLRERLRHEVAEVVAEARERVERRSEEGVEERCEKVVAEVSGAAPAEEGEKKFDGNAFFGGSAEDPFSEIEARRSEAEIQQSSEFDSLMWDDGWGAEGSLEAEYLSGKVIESEKLSGEFESKIKALETNLKTTEAENEKLKRELQEQTTKYAKALKKLKEVKSANERLLSETNQLKSSAGFGDLDAAIVEELKVQIENMEAKEKELVKNLENSKLEKESLLKKIDVLNAGNEKFLEMKERQDNEVEVWQRKNDELLKEIAALRQQATEAPVPDDNALLSENQELRNKMEALEWKNCELIELLEEKQELLEGSAQTSENNIERVMREKSELQKQIEELNNVKERLEKKLFDEEERSTITIGELNEQLTALATENETLQDILGEMKKSADLAKKNTVQEKTQIAAEAVPRSKIFDYFKSSPASDLFSFPAAPLAHIPQQSTAVEEADTLRRRVSDLEESLRRKEDELQKLRDASVEVERLRGRLSEAENAVRARDEELARKLSELRVEKDEEISFLRQKVAELNDCIGKREEERQTAKVSSEREVEALMFRVQELEGAAALEDQFETIDLTRPPEKAAGENEAEKLRQRAVELEGLLSQREEELRMLSQSAAADVDGLRQRIFQLENVADLLRGELNRSEANRSGEVDALRRKTAELEDLARFRENELCQLQSAKAAEVQSLSQRVTELESALQSGLGQQRAFEMESLLRMREEECERRTAEGESLRQRVGDLQGAVQAKDEEIGQLQVRLYELEKSYNDSKVEIERLLSEEKLNVEEKFVEPFQENMKIPVAFELEALSRTLDEEKLKSENLLYELSEKENQLAASDAQVHNLNSRLIETERQLLESTRIESAQRVSLEESAKEKAQLEKIVSDLQKETESGSLQLSVARRELEEFQIVKDEAIASLQSQLSELETELEETREQARVEVAELVEKTRYYEAVVQGGRAEEEERTRELERELEEERSRAEELRAVLTAREAEVADLKATLMHLQEEIGHFRNFEKQIKDLRVAQIKESGSEVPVTPDGHPDLSDWTEHELAELSTRLQSDLDTALYMLHQRDVRCDELTFELMQLLEERDTLQLRLSTALRINEELRAARPETASAGRTLQESKDLVDQSNDRQPQKARMPGEDLQKLANKISELHSVSYLRDKTVKDESVQRHKEQMNLLSRVSDSDVALSRDFQSSPTVLLNWMRGKTTPKVMHI